MLALDGPGRLAGWLRTQRPQVRVLPGIPPHVTRLDPGATLGRYHVARYLAIGYYAEVYELLGPDGETLAGKCFPDEPSCRAAFAREVEAYAVISHPRVPRIVEAFEDGAL